ncbi:hypothetical protein OJ253_2967 [Cryptosporidium canis]|uniref:Uncharacterized protein n=1 Tax=Cryptosporidium canis TaxID=195482 RepID=A0A9D5DEK8_9CRYT|nr:hypothetical protein OJ253_2967 [Cryptosporidium canis]
MMVVIYLLYVFCVMCEAIQGGVWGSRGGVGGFRYSNLEDWMPRWARARDIYLFKTLYYGREVGGLDASESGGSGLREVRCRVAVLTAGDEDFNTMVELERNRVEYSRKQGYCYLHFSCRSAESKEALGETPDSGSIDWVLYMDLDAMFTNYQVRVEQIIERYAMGSTSLIVSADTKCYDERYPINNGIMIFKNSLFSIQLAFQILIKQSYRDSLLYNSANLWNAKGLKDQPLLTNILVEDIGEVDARMIFKYCTFVMEHGLDLKGIVYSSEQITVVSPRVMNSVRRSSTHFRKDNLLWHWRSGDWIAHLSGLTPMASSLRKKFIKQVCDSSPDEVCPFTISIDNKELVEVENKLSLIRYKKEQKLLNPGGPKKTAKKSKKKTKPGPQKKSGDPLSIRVSLNLSNLESVQSDELRESSSDDTIQVSKNKEFSALQVSQQGSGGAELQGEKDSKEFLDPPISEESVSISSKETTSQCDLLEPVSGSEPETGSVSETVRILDSDPNVQMEVPSIGGSIEITLERVGDVSSKFPGDAEIAEQSVSPAESSG